MSASEKKTGWLALIGHEIAIEIAKKKPHAQAIALAYETARREFKKKYPGSREVPDYLKEPDMFQRRHGGHRGAVPVAQWPTHKKNPAMKKTRKKKAKTVTVVGAGVKTSKPNSYVTTGKLVGYIVDVKNGEKWTPLATFPSGAVGKKNAVLYARSYADRFIKQLRVRQR